MARSAGRSQLPPTSSCVAPPTFRFQSARSREALGAALRKNIQRLMGDRIRYPRYGWRLHFVPKDGNCAFHLLHFWEPWVGGADAAVLRLQTAQKIEDQEVKLDANFLVPDAPVSPEAATPGTHLPLSHAVDPLVVSVRALCVAVIVVVDC